MKPCNEKAALLDAYSTATAEYSRAVLYLSAGITSNSGYHELRQLSEVARMKTEAARVALDNHIVEHAC